MTEAMPGTWYKTYAGMIDNPIWDLVAERANTSVPVVLAVYFAAMDSSARHGGLLDHFRPEALAKRFGITLKKVRQLWNWFQKLGLRSEDQLRGWLRRQSAFLCRRITQPATFAKLPDDPCAAGQSTRAKLPPTPPSDEREETRQDPPCSPPHRGDGEGDLTISTRSSSAAEAPMAANPASAADAAGQPTGHGRSTNVLAFEAGPPRRETRAQRQSRESAEFERQRRIACGLAG